MALIIGLTGGIGCGKSIASQIFSSLGINIIDTDVIAKELTQTNGQAIQSIREIFGDDYLNGDGSLNRGKMRQLVFSDSALRIKLESILHPLILKEVLQQVSQVQSPYVIIAIPLLIESKDYDHLLHRVLVVDCEEQLQISRTMMRNQLSEQQVKAIMATQVSRDARLQKADDVLVNNKDIEYLKTQILQLHHKYLVLSKNQYN